MAMTKTRCAYCNVPIVDETTETVVGGQPYCCLNCAMGARLLAVGASAMTRAPENAQRCACCGVPILDETTKVMDQSNAYCCQNCLDATKPQAASRRA